MGPTGEEPNPGRRPRTDAELLQQAQECTDFLIRSGKEFDRGRQHEAKQIAHHLRTLLHHTADKPRPGNSHALLYQTGHLGTLHFLDSGGDFEPGDLFRSTLVAMAIDPVGAEWLPRMEAHRRYVDTQSPPGLRQPGGHLGFDDWWEAVVLVDIVGNRFTRRRLVLAQANEEGGSHVDPKVRPDVQALAYDRSMGWSTPGPIDTPYGRGQVKASSPLPAAVRQIGWEVHNTIYGQATELLLPEHRGTPPPREPVTSGDPGGFIITRMVAHADPPPGVSP